jgi:biopolymer transport protein ExbD
MAKKIPQINASSMADISFLLLIFFLVTTSMDVNQGLARRLPPPPEDEQKVEDEENKVKKRNLLIVKINSANQLMVQGQLLDIHQLRDKVKEFVLNENDDPHLPEVFTDVDFGAPIGYAKHTKQHVISVQNDVDTEYQAYLDVQNELVAAYNELRNECAQGYFHKAYNELSEDQQKQVMKVYPQKISEAEPKNYGGN